jgi:hypothetical protein
MLLVVSQLRDAGKTMAWVLQIPTTQDSNNVSKSDEIHTISKFHQYSLEIVTFFRMCTVIVLLWIGLNFLARQTDYIGLLLDGVALIFIVEVEEIVYTRVIRQDARTAWEDRKAIPLKKIGLFAGSPDLLDLAWFFFLVVCAIIFMSYYTTTVVAPLYDALKCACLSEGEHCFEAHAFSYAFWQQYWLEDVPQSIAQISRLKMKGMFSLVELDSASSTVASATRHVGNLLQKSLRP